MPEIGRFVGFKAPKLHISVFCVTAIVDLAKAGVSIFVKFGILIAFLNFKKLTFKVLRLKSWNLRCYFSVKCFVLS